MKSFARVLRDKAKLTTEQAEGFADAFSELMRDDVATKQDVEGSRLAIGGDIEVLRSSTEVLRSSTRGDITGLRSGLRESELRLEAKIESTKSEIIKRMFGAIGFPTIIVLGAVITLARVMH